MEGFQEETRLDAGRYARISQGCWTDCTTSPGLLQHTWIPHCRHQTSFLYCCLWPPVEFRMTGLYLQRKTVLSRKTSNAL